MPEDKYNFAPSPSMGEFKGVRTFATTGEARGRGELHRWRARFSAKNLPSNSAARDGPENIKSKADIVKFLKDSFDYAHKALKSFTDQNGLELVQSPLGPNKPLAHEPRDVHGRHPFDHYGQMVEYLRMNEIVPPASRQ